MDRYIFLVSIGILIVAATSDDKTPIPANKKDLDIWFHTNVGPLSSRKSTMDATLVAAEANSKTITVRKDGHGDYRTVTDALQNIRRGNRQRVIIDIGPGVYVEKINITQSFVTSRGSKRNMPTLQYDGTALTYGTVYSATVQIMYSDFFIAENIIFKNSAPRPKAQAVALTITGDKAAFYNCRFLGFQDTLCDSHGRHFFKDCYIEGTYDFIFENGKSLYLNTELYPIADGELTSITAQARENANEDTEYLFVHCSVTGIGSGAYLGRTWRSMARVVFAYTNMSKVVNPAGWLNTNDVRSHAQPYFGEYKSFGEGWDPNRRKFTHIPNDREMRSILNLGFIQGSEWLLPPQS